MRSHWTLTYFYCLLLYSISFHILVDHSKGCKNYSSIDPRWQKHAKDFSGLRPALAAARNTAWRVSTTRTASASARHQRPICATPPAHSSQRPAPCFRHARSQPTAPSTSAQRPRPVCTTRAASSQSTTHTQHPATAPSTGALSPPRAQQGIITYDLAR